MLKGLRVRKTEILEVYREKKRCLRNRKEKKMENKNTTECVVTI